MNECDADRVLQIRQSVREQAHCELPVVEKLGTAIYRWTMEPVGLGPIWLGVLFAIVYCIGVIRGALGKRRVSGKTSNGRKGS